MPNGLIKHGIAGAAGRIPGLRRLPVLKLLAVAEIILLVRDHVAKLEPGERRRLVQLVRRGRGRKHNLSPTEQEELAHLVAKAEPRALAGEAADKLSPVPLPRRIVHGPDRR
jgi:hypothetical protein